MSIGIDVESLAGILSIVLDLFDAAENGKSIVDAIQTELKLFNNAIKESISVVFATAIGSEFSKRSAQLWKLKPPPKRPFEEWDEFVRMIKYDKRFFTPEPFSGLISKISSEIANSSNSDLHHTLLPLGEKEKKPARTIYRARINPPSGRYYIASLGAPSPEITTGGRANPHGIPYLYLASDVDTAIAETRPHKGQSVSVGSFEPERTLTLVRFGRISVMQAVMAVYFLDSEKSIHPLYVQKVFELIAESLSAPLDPSIASIDYLPTQYICEVIKQTNCDGVMFKSAMGNGSNYVISM